MASSSRLPVLEGRGNSTNQRDPIVVSTKVGNATADLRPRIGHEGSHCSEYVRHVFIVRGNLMCVLAD